MRLPQLPEHLELEPRASDLLDLLRDLGHLDDFTLEKLTGEIVAEPRSRPVVTYEEVRRRAALLLFDSPGNPLSKELLDAEWGRIFY